MFADSMYDVFVLAPGTDETRRAILPRLVLLYPLDEPRADALARGERVLLQRDASRADATRIAATLRSIGCRVDLESRNASLEAVGLDGGEARDVARGAAPLDNPLFDIGAGLVGLDGATDTQDDAPPPRVPTRAADPLGLLGATLLDDDEPLADDRVAKNMSRPKAPPPLPVDRSIPVAATPKAAPVALASTPSRFRPTDLDDEAAQLAIDRPPPSTSIPQMDAAADVVASPRCPTHDVETVRGRCPRCAADDAYVKSRVMGGTLRQKPALRYGIGIGAGLFLGWIITSPMSRHGDMRAQNLREQATRERARPTEEAQAKAAQLDAEADDVAQGSTLHTLGTWAIVIAAVTAGWLKLS